jgi:hypothetical protein
MATWIVHLRIAENLLATFPGLDANQFAVGNIAPDSGMPDEKWEKFDPPAEVLHFSNGKDRPFSIDGDLLFFRKYLGKMDFSEDSKRFGFLLGYFTHLATDNLWSLEIAQPTLKKHKTKFDADKDFIWEVKDDWYGLDHVYVREFPASLFWKTFLNCSYRADYLDFLPEKNIQVRVDYIRDFYQRDDEKIRALLDRPFKYLSKANMNKFVDEASQKLISWIKQLQEDPRIFSALDSVTQK